MQRKRGFTHESSHNESKEWYTPPHIFDALKIPFDMDVASPGAAKVPWIPAQRHITIREDGLIAPWSGCVWCNPPYGSDTPAWTRRMAVYRHGIMIVFSRCDTQWFHQWGKTADLLLFVEGRIRFLRPPDHIKQSGKKDGGPGCGHMLLAWGPDCVQALLSSGLGVCMKPVGVKRPKQPALLFD